MSWTLSHIAYNHVEGVCFSFIYFHRSTIYSRTHCHRDLFVLELQITIVPESILFRSFVTVLVLLLFLLFTYLIIVKCFNRSQCQNAILIHLIHTLN